jgi:hypothetical protein
MTITHKPPSLRGSPSGVETKQSSDWNTPFDGVRSFLKQPPLPLGRGGWGGEGCNRRGATTPRRAPETALSEATLSFTWSASLCLSAANKPAEFFVTFLCAKEKLDKRQIKQSPSGGCFVFFVKYNKYA